MFVTSLTLLMNEICRLINNLKKKKRRKEAGRTQRKNERKKRTKGEKGSIKKKVSVN